MNLSRRFRVDARRFVERLNSILLAVESDPGRTDLVHEAFRQVHSLKSEAAMLQLDDIVSEAHRAEGILAAMREEGGSIPASRIDELFRSVDAIQALVVVSSGVGTPTEDSKPVNVAVNEDAQDILEPEDLLDFSPFERTLLAEAGARGERLYRIVCEIEESAPLKYAKAYLLVNNLEQLVNVIKVVPELSGDVDDDSYRMLHMAFTSDSGEADIHAAVNVDQVKRVELAVLDIRTYLKPAVKPAIEAGIEQVEAQAVSPPQTAEPAGISSDLSTGSSTGSDEEHETTDESSVTVRTDKIDELLGYVDELKIGLRSLANRLERIGAEESLHPSVSGLETLTAGIDEVIREFRLVRLDEEFESYPRLVRDMARELGKRVELTVTGGQVTVDRRILDLVAIPLRHLLRNAVDHGIEMPDERIASGKEANGEISVAATLDGDVLHVLVRDDGRGIEPDGLAGGPAVDVEKLLDVISAPGFSTKKNVSDLSGRGVGLDSVRATVEGTPGGRLLLETEPGRGASFEIIIPKSYTLLGYLLAVAGDLTIALPRQNIEEIVRLDTGRVIQNDDGAFWCEPETSAAEPRRFPIFSVNGRIFIVDGTPAEETGLLVSHLGRRGILLVREVLYEQDHPRNHVEIGAQLSPFLYRLRIDGRDVGYRYLDPALISS